MSRILLPSEAESISLSIFFPFSFHWKEEDKSIIVTLNIIIFNEIIELKQNYTPSIFFCLSYPSSL